MASRSPGPGIPQNPASRPGDREAIENTVKLKFSTGRYKIENLIVDKDMIYFLVV